MPRGKREQADQIILKLREAELELSRGKTVPEAAKKIGVTEQTYYRWKKKYGGLRMDQAKRLKDLEKENARLKRLLADAADAGLADRIDLALPTAPLGVARHLENADVTVERDGDHVVRSHRPARRVATHAVDPHQSRINERGRRGARPHDPRVPHPFIDALAIQRASGSGPLLVGLKLRLQSKQLGERRIRIGLLAAARRFRRPPDPIGASITVAITARAAVLAIRPVTAFVALLVAIRTLLTVGALFALAFLAFAAIAAMPVAAVVLLAIAGRCRRYVCRRSFSGRSSNGPLGGGLAFVGIADVFQ